MEDDFNYFFFEEFCFLFFFQRKIHYFRKYNTYKLMDFEMLCRRKKNGMKQAMNELLMITILRISKIKNNE